MIKHVISVSGGKDSAATLLLALERCPQGSVVPIFCDTGNEHEAVYEYLSYLELALDIQIVRLKADFTEQIAAKRMFVARDQRTRREYKTGPVVDDAGKPVFKRNLIGNIILHAVSNNGKSIIKPIQKTKRIGGGRKIRWTNKAKRRALGVLYPTGNPYLDLCLWKGRFPSRKAQFCTEELKRNIAVSYQLDLIDAGHQVLSWQGVRRDESLNRRNAKKIERLGPRLWAFRPLVEWSAMDVFNYCNERKIQPNPLYKLGMSRVGCMPCINVNKAELRQIAARFPDHIAKISQWEELVAKASKRQAATFIPAPGITANEAKQHDIYHVVLWSRTKRGGKELDPLASLIEPTGCSSSYGLCDQSTDAINNAVS